MKVHAASSMAAGRVGCQLEYRSLSSHRLWLGFSALTALCMVQVVTGRVTASLPFSAFGRCRFAIEQRGLGLPVSMRGTIGPGLGIRACRAHHCIFYPHPHPAPPNPPTLQTPPDAKAASPYSRQPLAKSAAPPVCCKCHTRGLGGRSWYLYKRPKPWATRSVVALPLAALASGFPPAPLLLCFVFAHRCQTHTKTHTCIPLHCTSPTGAMLAVGLKRGHSA